jgi:hypothetical protein
MARPSSDLLRATDARKRALLVAVLVVLISSAAFLALWLGLSNDRAPAAVDATTPLNVSDTVVDHVASSSSSSTTDRESAAGDRAIVWTLRVLDAANREPVAGAHVQLRAGEWRADASSSGDGSAAFRIDASPQVDALIHTPG